MARGLVLLLLSPLLLIPPFSNTSGLSFVRLVRRCICKWTCLCAPSEIRFISSYANKSTLVDVIAHVPSGPPHVGVCMCMCICICTCVHTYTRSAPILPGQIICTVPGSNSGIFFHCSVLFFLFRFFAPGSNAGIFFLARGENKNHPSETHHVL